MGRNLEQPRQRTWRDGVVTYLTHPSQLYSWASLAALVLDIPTAILLPLRTIDPFDLWWAVIMLAVGAPLGILAVFLTPSKAKKVAAACCGGFAIVAAQIVWPF